MCSRGVCCQNKGKRGVLGTSVAKMRVRRGMLGVYVAVMRISWGA